MIFSDSNPITTVIFDLEYTFRMTLICFFNNFNYFTKRDYKEKSESNKERYQPLGPYVYPSA